jgi:hypothetical protein
MVDKLYRGDNGFILMEQKTIKILSFIIGVPIIFLLVQNADAGEHKKRLSIIPLENPTGWAAPYNPGKIIAEMLRNSVSGKGNFHLSPRPRQPRSKENKGNSAETKMQSKGAQLKHPIQYILGGKILHFTPGRPPSRAQIILNIGDALKQRAELEIELKLTSHHLEKSIARKKFKISSIAGTTPFDLDASKVEYDSPKFKNSSIGKALQEMNQQVNAFMMTALHPLPLEAEIISVDHEKMEVIINVGQIDGIDFGDLFNVYSVTMQYKDPFTQIDLGSGFARRGVIKVNTVQEGYSKAVIVAGKGFKMGELAQSRKTNPVLLDRSPPEENSQLPW